MRTTGRATFVLIAVGAGLSACTTLFGEIDFKGKEASGGGGAASSSSSSGGGGSSSTTSSSSGTATTCSNDKKDGDETGKDCGGSCDPCADGEGCKTGADCKSKVCGPGGTCVAPACDDKAKNGDETDADCGGQMCGPCAFGKGCAKDSDCVTAFCNGTTCDAETIVSGLTNPNSLAVDDWGVYWADGDDGTIMQADFATLTPAQLVGGRSGPEGLVIQPKGASMPSGLYWVERSAGKVVESGTQSLPQTPWTTAAGQDSPSALTVAPDMQYPVWTANGAVWTYKFTETTILSFTGQGGKIAVVSDGSADCHAIIYATDEAGGTLWNRSNGTCSSNWSYTVSSGHDITGLTADTTSMYWTEGGMSGTVARSPLFMSTITTSVLAPNQPHPSDVRVDDLNVYWINQGTSDGTGTVMKVPRVGGALTTLASQQNAPRGLFVTQSDVYWISGAKGQGAIKRLAK